MRTLFAVTMSLVTAIMAVYLIGAFIQLNFHYLHEITPTDRGGMAVFTVLILPFSLLGWLTLLEKDDAS